MRNSLPVYLKENATSISLYLIIILGFFVYSNALPGKFIWDDNSAIVENATIKSFSNIFDAFARGSSGNYREQNIFYRPVQTLTYMSDYFLWRLNNQGYHFTNILLHVLTAIAVYLLINMLYNNQVLSLLTGILFVVHPVHAEAVAYISGRADPLSALFALLSIIFYIRYINSDNRVSYILSLLSYLLAVLSKESGLILPVPLLLYHYAFKKDIRFRKFLPFIVLASAYLFFRIAVLRPVLFDAGAPTTLPERLPGVFVALLKYIKIMLFPFGLHMEYGRRLFGFNNPVAIAGFAVSCFIIAYAFLKRRSGGVVFFSISWFFLTLAPSLNIYPVNAYMAEHWLYLPSIGFFLLLSRGLLNISGTKRPGIFAVTAIAGLVAFYSYLTIKQNGYWREPVKFYERTLRYAPFSSRVNNNLASEYLNAGKTDEAIALYRRSIEIDPGFPNAYSNLGLLYYNAGRKEEAILLYNKTLEVDPGFADAYYNLGLAYYEMDNRKKAVTLYRKAISVDPRYSKAHNALGVAYYELGKTEEAILSLKKAIALDPAGASSYNNLGNIYKDIGMIEDAVWCYKKALEINPALAQTRLKTLLYTGQEN